MHNKIALRVCRIGIPQKNRSHTDSFSPKYIKIINTLFHAAESFLALKILSFIEGMGI